MSHTALRMSFAALIAVLALQAGAETEDAPSQEPEPSGKVAVFRTAVNGEAAAFTLRDQFRDEMEYRLPQDRVHVVFITDRHSGYATVDWYKRFEETFGERLGYYGVGALDEIPALMRPLVRPFLRRQVDKPILLDWRNEVCDAWHCEERTPNIYLVHPDGSIGAHITGRICDESFEESAAILEDMLAANVGQHHD